MSKQTTPRALGNPGGTGERQITSSDEGPFMFKVEFENTPLGLAIVKNQCEPFTVSYVSPDHHALGIVNVGDNVLSINGTMFSVLGEVKVCLSAPNNPCRPLTLILAATPGHTRAGADYRVLQERSPESRSLEGETSGDKQAQRHRTRCCQFHSDGVCDHTGASQA
jgi:hypothetical protein